MKLRKILLAIFSALVAMALIGCGQGTTVPEELPNSDPQESKSTSQPGSLVRTITDLGGNTVTLPPAEEITKYPRYD